MLIGTAECLYFYSRIFLQTSYVSMFLGRLSSSLLYFNRFTRKSGNFEVTGSGIVGGGGVLRAMSEAAAPLNPKYNTRGLSRFKSTVGQSQTILPITVDT